jgi:CHAT domain-containing protein/Tfp pilus assembly protein PilF
VLALASLAASSAAPISLRDGFAVEREVAGGETHVYPVELAEGEFLRVTVDQDGIDVLVKLLDPEGRTVLAVDTSGKIGDEDLAAVAERQGAYRVEVGAGGGAPAGRYRMRVEGPRQPSERDLLRVEAVRVSQESLHWKIERREDLHGQVQSWKQALALWLRLGEPRREAESRFSIGSSLLNLGDYESALGDLRRAAELWGGLGDRFLKAAALYQAGRTCARLTRWEEARAHLEASHALFREIGDRREEIKVLNSLGVVYTDLGEPQTAVLRLEESLRIAREERDGTRQASILNNLGSAYDQSGDKQKAILYQEEALAVARAAANSGEEATALNNLGDTYFSLGHWEKARSFFLQALELNRKMGDLAREAKTLNNLGATATQLGDLDGALSLHDQALALGRENGDPVAQGFALNNLGSLYFRLNQFDKTIARCGQALSLAVGRADIEINARHLLGAAHRKRGNLAAAREEVEKALALSRKRGSHVQQAEITLSLARLEREAGDLGAALSGVQEAVEIIESLRERVDGAELRALFLGANQTFYEFSIDTLMALHKARPEAGFAADALQMSERARARSLLEILNEAGAEIRRWADPALLERERRLRTEVSLRERRRLELLSRGEAAPEPLAEAQKRLVEALDKYQQVQLELRASSPRYTALTQPRPLDLLAIQTQVLDGNALLLEYALGEERSYLWAITPKSVQGFELPKRADIEAAATRYYELLTARNRDVPGESVPTRRQRENAADAELAAAALDLSRLILRPVEPLLGARTLLFVADGALQYIPFAALPIPSSGVPLVDQHEVVTLPSASALAVLRREIEGRPKPPGVLAVLADPVFQRDDTRLTRRGTRKETLPTATHRGPSLLLASPRGTSADLLKLPRLIHSESEAKTILALVPAGQKLFQALGFAASREAATSGELAGYRNVHFATHGILQSDHPELSSLALSMFDERGQPQDGFLRLNDIYNLELNADLVVLSACQTALGKDIRGEGLVGLTRGFMYAGAARVLASLWSVEDRATAELMKRFYRAMLIDRLSPAAALRQAQIEMSRIPRFRSPYFWAGFTLQGEWR